MSYFCLNLGQTAEDSDMFTIIWLSSRGLTKRLHWRECRAYVSRCLRRRCWRRCSTGATHRCVVRYRIHFQFLVVMLFLWRSLFMWESTALIPIVVSRITRSQTWQNVVCRQPLCCTTHLCANPYWNNTFPFKFRHAQLSKHDANAAICIVRTAHDHAASYAA